MSTGGFVQTTCIDSNECRELACIMFSIAQILYMCLAPSFCDHLHVCLCKVQFVKAKIIRHRAIALLWGPLIQVISVAMVRCPVGWQLAEDEMGSATCSPPPTYSGICRKRQMFTFSSGEFGYAHPQPYITSPSPRSVA